MKSFKQLLRQPLKTLSGVLLITLAVAVLVTCVGQYTATSLTRAKLEDHYDTVALVSFEALREKIGDGMTYYSQVPEEKLEWINQTVETRKDLIKAESFTEVYSAYIPSLRIDNFSQYPDGDCLNEYNVRVGIGNPYRCAMLEVKLEKLSTKIKEHGIWLVKPGEDEFLIRNYIDLLCLGTVEGVIGLEEGFSSPVGHTIALVIRVYDESELEALQLKTGDRYLVYGMNYTDVKGKMFTSFIEHNYSEQFLELYGDLYMAEKQVDCYMTVYDHSSIPATGRFDEGYAARVDLRKLWFWEGMEKYSQFIPVEEYPDYRAPTIQKLEGTVEGYLAGEDAFLWNRALDEMEINNHGFPVLAVEKLGHQVTFARGQARIVQGRDFTEAERTGGGKVCIISETVATLNGLTVGDTIEMRTYGYDLNIEAQTHGLPGTTFPSAAIYSHNLGFCSEPERYTIVGLYRQSNAWQNFDDPYGITPNVIFVPKGSVSGDPLTGTAGIFYTLVLHNGKMEEFQALQKEAGYPDLFICYDQGYAQIKTDLQSYETVSSRALYVGLAAYGVILLLFILLFPLGQREQLVTMRSLGAGRGSQVGHVLLSTLGILLPGAVLGGICGLFTQEMLTRELMETVAVTIPLEANGAYLIPAVASLQLIPALLLTAAAAIFLSRGKMKGRRM